MSKKRYRCRFESVSISVVVVVGELREQDEIKS